MKVYSRYDLPPSEGVACPPEEGRTKQAFAEEADINRLVERYGVPGVVSMPGVERAAMYGDFSTGLDFMEAQERILGARRAFQALPARVRDRFGNDPAALLEFLSDERNADEAVRLGLFEVQGGTGDVPPASGKPMEVKPAGVSPVSPEAAAPEPKATA